MFKKENEIFKPCSLATKFFVNKIRFIGKSDFNLMDAMKICKSDRKCY